MTQAPSNTPTMRLGDWLLDPLSGDMRQGDSTVRLEQRTLRLLMCLVEQPGEVISAEAILKTVWPDVVVSPDSVYQAITALRRQLGDDSKNPRYIMTVPRRGYRWIAEMTETAETAETTESAALPAAPVLPVKHPLRKWISLTLAVIISILAVSLIPRLAASRAINPRAVAVLPFQDLTDQMREEPFADGMTEEMIHQLAKTPGVIVAPPAALQDLKGQHLSNTELAKKLHVAFILEGSVRKSGPTLRVAARLTRASDGFVAWSESYDRAWDDKLMIQQDIAGEVSKALAKSVH